MIVSNLFRNLDAISTRITQNYTTSKSTRGSSVSVWLPSPHYASFLLWTPSQLTWVYLQWLWGVYLSAGCLSCSGNMYCDGSPKLSTWWHIDSPGGGQSSEHTCERVPSLGYLRFECALTVGSAMLRAGILGYVKRAKMSTSVHCSPWLPLLPSHSQDELYLETIDQNSRYGIACTHGQLWTLTPGCSASANNVFGDSIYSPCVPSPSCCTAIPSGSVHPGSCN